MNEIGEYNRNEISKLGFDAIFIKRIDVSRALAKDFIEGNPKVAWDAGVNSGPVKIALKLFPQSFMQNMGSGMEGWFWVKIVKKKEI